MLSRYIFIISLLCVFRLAGEQPTVHIGIALDSDDLGFTRVEKWLKQEVHKLLDGEFNVVFSDHHRYIGQWSVAKIRENVDKALQNPEIDLVVGIGAISSQNIATRKILPKPCFAPFIMNADMQNLPQNDGVTGIKNLNYFAFPTDLERDFILLNEIAPYKKLAVFVNQFVLEEIPMMRDVLNYIAKENEITIEIIPVGLSAKEVMANLPLDCDAAYILPLTQLNQEGLDELAQGLIERKIPSFSIFTTRYLKTGFMASMSPDNDIPRMIRRLALNIQRVLLGEDAGKLSVKVTESDQLAINMRTAEAVGVSPKWKMLQEAVLIDYESQKVGMDLSFLDAVMMGIERNLELAAYKKNVAIGCEDVRKSRSNLLPHVDVGGWWRRIDKDRARGSLGLLYENEVCSRAGLSQVLYSNEIFGDFKVQKYLQYARRYGYCSEFLETVLIVAQAYLDLLRARTLEGIHYRNLERTRSHLKVARQRVRVGTARSSEVYRWESQHANDLTQVTQAKYDTRKAEAKLKRILNLPQGEKVFLTEVTLEENYWVKKKDWLEENIFNDKSLELLIDYSVIDGLKHSTELKEIHSAICAQAEVLGIKKRAFWSPDVFFTADVKDCFSEWGAHSELRRPFNSTDWILAVNVSFPLYSGGAKSAEKRQACYELQKLFIEKEALIEAIKEQIRITLYCAANSYTALELSRKSAKTADENLKLVSEGYSKGVMMIVDLIDAQNQSLVSNLETANAVYDFLTDLMVVQRNLGRYDFLMSDEEMNEWIARVNTFFKENG